MENFEKDVMNIVKNLELRKIKDEFQDRLKEDVKKINASPNILVFADKPSNIYEQNPEEHRKILKENITKTYKKAPNDLEHEINLEAKEIAENLELDDRINCLAKTQAFITMKDHKEDFPYKPNLPINQPRQK